MEILTYTLLPQNTSTIWEQCNTWLCGMAVFGRGFKSHTGKQRQLLHPYTGVRTVRY